METIHIHDVLDIIYSADRLYTIDQLKEEVVSRFGEDISMTSCSENEFGIAEMVNFMLQRRKITLDGDLIIPIGHSCSH